MVKVKNYLFSLLITFLVSAVLLCLSAVIFAYTNINDRYLQTFVFGVIVISVLIGSTILSKKIKEKGLLLGGTFGAIYVLLIFLITSIAYTGFAFTNTLLIYLGISVLSGIVGGIIGVNI